MTGRNNADSLDNQAGNMEGLHFPSLEEIFQTQRPVAEPPRVETIPLQEQEALLFSVDDALKKAELGDTAAFEGMPDALSKLWHCQSEFFLRATEALANGSRNPPLRLVYGRTGILDFFLQLISSKEIAESSLILHSLRLIGNSCADTDENRATVVNYIPAILRYLLWPELRQVVIPVIYNLCIDYEPAQSQLAANKIVYILLKLVKDDAFQGNDALINYVYELIELVGEQEQGIERSPDGTISLLLAMTAAEQAQFCVLANCTVAYINNTRFQDICISRCMVPGILSMLTRSLSFKSTSSDDTQALAQSRLKINQALAEVSASPLFAESYPLDSSLPQTLKSWLSSSEDQLQICACIMLGNLARSDEVCVAMVKELKIHEDLIALLNSNVRGAALHSALGFLRNLAIASDNRIIMGEAGIVPAVAPLWAYETVPQVQLAATSITRQLVISSIENIGRLLEPTEGKEAQTYLSLLLALFEKTDSTPIKTEIGRITASICRTLISKCNTAGGHLLNSLFTHKGIALPLGAMVTQTQWPVVRSEGWFALALMASTKAGSNAVVNGLHTIDGFSLIEQTLSAAEPSDNEADKAQWLKDRDNIIVLVQELSKNESDAVNTSWKSTMQDLMSRHVSRYLKQSNWV
ncbi:armadillo-type protein [Aspergillus falconensis]